MLDVNFSAFISSTNTVRIVKNDQTDASEKVKFDTGMKQEFDILLSRRIRVVLYIDDTCLRILVDFLQGPHKKVKSNPRGWDGYNITRTDRIIFF